MSERCAARVLIVGAGLTGALTARRLRQQLPLAHLVIWDAAPAAGGRMRCERALGALTDSGAQYVTQVVSSEGAVANRAVHEELQEQGLLVRVTGAVEGTRAADGAGASYVCPEGLDALVSAIISRASATLVCGRRAERIGLDEAGLGWEVRAHAAQTGAAAAAAAAAAGAHAHANTAAAATQTTAGDDTGGALTDETAAGTVDHFDAIVLTPPAPDLLPLLSSGDAHDWVDAHGVSPQPRIASLQYSARSYPLTHP